MKKRTETEPTDRQLLLEIRDLLRAQQNTLEQHPAHPKFGWKYLKYLMIIGALALSIGGYGAYQYFRILESIISQFPH